MENANQLVPMLKHLALIAAAIVWCVMTMAFLVVPYAMGDDLAKVIGGTQIHSTQAAVLYGRSQATPAQTVRNAQGVGAGQTS